MEPTQTQPDDQAKFCSLPSLTQGSEPQVLMKLCANYSHEFLLWQSLDGQIKFISESCRHITGHSPAEFTQGERLLERLIHPEDLSLWQSRHIGHKHHQTIQVRLISKDGTIIWLEHNCSPICDNGGNVTGHIGTFVDISNIKQSEQTSRKLSLALEQNDYGVAITTCDGIIEYANPAFIEMNSSTIKTIAGDFFFLLHPDSNSAETIKNTISEHNVWREELKLEHSENWLSVRISPIFDDLGHLTNYLIATFDINLRIHNKELLKKQHDQLQELFKKVETGKREWEKSLDCIEDVVLLVNRSDKVVRSNKAIKFLYNLDIDDLLGKNWRTLLPADLANAEQLPKEGQFHDATLGKWLQFRVFAFKAETFSTEVDKIIVIHDTTAMWQMNQDLADAYDQMKATQGQMVHQEKMASIGQLAAGVAHEINNPTGFINSNLSSLAKYTNRLNDHIDFLENIIQNSGDQDAMDAIKQHKKQLKLTFIQEDIVDLIDESLEGAQRITTIVQNLKSFSRVDDTASSVNNLHECLDAALSIGWNEIKYTATVNKDYQEIPDIYCSAQQLNQVFLNLMVNAAQAMDEPGEITISTATEEPWVVIKISDNGAGIPKEILSRIFEPFFTTKDVGKGTGLGLSICYDIIQKHDGELSVESELGEGTTFTIKLPIITEEPEHTADAS